MPSRAPAAFPDPLLGHRLLGHRLLRQRLLRQPLTRRTVVRSLAAAGGLALLAACGTADAANTGSGSLSLVAYSTPKDAYAKLIPAFQQTAPGKGVPFTQSYGASGSQARAIVAGLPTDVAALSLAPDVSKLVTAGLVAPSWDADAYHGIVTRSVVVLVVRKGNPKDIKGWDDLVRPGVKVLTPNPLSSGGARWNVMAAYGAQIKAGRSRQQALQYLQQLFAHVAVQDASAAASLQTFTSGVGDVLLSYENEAIAAKAKGADVDWVVPDSTILIENPIAVSTKSKNATAAKAFVDFLRTKPAQQIFANFGYRPVLDGVTGPYAFPTPPELFTIADLGGWKDVSTTFFDPKSGLIVPVEKAVGVSGG